MATQHEIVLAQSMIQALDAYWSYVNSFESSGQTFSQARQRLEDAQSSMDWLVSRAQYDAQIRQMLAQANIFSQALTREHNRVVDQSAMPLGVAAPGGLDWALDLSPSFDNKPPRLIMLQSLRRWAGGTFMSPPEKEGITPWIFDEELAETAIANTLINDPYPAVVLELLSILATCAYPAAWAAPRAGEMFGAGARPSRLVEVLQQVDAALPFNVCPVPDPNRTSISQRSGSFCTSMTTPMFQAFSATTKRAIGRAQQLAADQALQAVMGGSAPPGTWTVPQTGNAARVPTPPPPRRAWWKDGRYWSAGVLGLVSGALYATKRR